MTIIKQRRLGLFSVTYMNSAQVSSSVLALANVPAKPGKILVLNIKILLKSMCKLF